ncbi:MAG: NAD-dependent deacetylase [Rhodothermaceae bacterium]
MLELPENFIQRLKTADSIVFFTGAGISAESGIATFRGDGGIWKKFRPEELANFDAFMNNPDRVWEWYQYRRDIVNDCQPNPGHHAIAEFEKYFDKVTVVTQNVDGLHARAGSNEIYELHGNIERNFCVDCKTFYDSPEIKKSEKTPKCEKCGGLVRPDVVWFGEALPMDIFSKGEKAAEKSDICFIVGTSAVVYPAAHIPISAKRAGSYLVEINLDSTEISGSVNLSIKGKSGEILPEIMKLVKNVKQ